MTVPARLRGSMSQSNPPAQTLERPQAQAVAGAASEPDGMEPDGMEPDGMELDGMEPDGMEPDGMHCDFCGDLVMRVRRVVLDGAYERLPTRHVVRYACQSCSDEKERQRLGLAAATG